MMKFTFVAILISSLVPYCTSAATVDVFANANSVNNNSGPIAGAATGLVLSSGDKFRVSASTTDYWQLCFGHPSDPDGCTVDADGVRSLDGTTFFNYSTGGLTAVVGTLVGSIGGGQYFAIGTSYSGTANTSGELKLFAWDTDSRNNSGFITANVQVVPLPAGGALLLSALLGGIVLRRRKTAS